MAHQPMNKTSVNLLMTLHFGIPSIAHAHSLNETGIVVVVVVVPLYKSHCSCHQRHDERHQITQGAFGHFVFLLIFLIKVKKINS